MEFFFDTLGGVWDFGLGAKLKISLHVDICTSTKETNTVGIR